MPRLVRRFRADASRSRTDRDRAIARDKEIPMKARAYILTLGTSLALLTPATQVASGGIALPTQITTLEWESQRGTLTTQPLRPICGTKKVKSCVPPRYYQVLKNSY
jgi:hypothetical protein